MKEYSLQDLRSLPTSEPPKYIIDGLLRTRRGRPSILGGFDHVGKSTLAQQMAKCVAKGEPFLSRSTCQGKVLYFQTEESVEDAKIDFLKNMPDENESIVVLHPDNPKNNFEELKAKLDKHPDTVFVIIETLMDFLEYGMSRTMTNAAHCSRSSAMKSVRSTKTFPSCSSIGCVRRMPLNSARG